MARMDVFEDDELSRFAAWYLSMKPNLPLKPPMDNSLHFVDGLHALVLWREGRFQVELITVSPGVNIPPHAHPNVDSFEVNLNGGVNFFIENQRTMSGALLSRRQGDYAAFYGQPMRVRPGVLHWAEFSPTGGVFMSIQHWPEGINMESVGCDWNGEKTMGEKHSKVLNHG